MRLNGEHVCSAGCAAWKSLHLLLRLRSVLWVGERAKGFVGTQLVENCAFQALLKANRASSTLWWEDDRSE